MARALSQSTHTENHTVTESCTVCGHACICKSDSDEMNVAGKVEDVAGGSRTCRRPSARA